MNELRLRITGIHQETPDTVTISFVSTDGEPIDYQAGQFITLIPDFNGHELRRSYSFSSTPGVDPEISITVRRVVNGAVSRWLTEYARIGDELKALAPAGRFRMETIPSAKRQIWMIAAGSGIVPIFSLLKKVLREEPLSNMVLLYQNRHEHNIIFEKELQSLQKKFPGRIHFQLLLSSPAQKNKSSRLTNDTLDAFLKKYRLPDREELFFLCGPAAFMRMAQFTLRVNGVDHEHIRKENFTVDFVPPAPFIQDASPKHVTLHLGKEIFHFTVVYPKSILQAALDHNIPLPYSCRGGRCSSCVASCLKGTVKMSINEVLTEPDLAAGLVLTCVGFAATDLVLKM